MIKKDFFSYGMCVRLHNFKRILQLRVFFMSRQGVIIIQTFVRPRQVHLLPFDDSLILEVRN
jgi:hypothetical protein